MLWAILRSRALLESPGTRTRSAVSITGTNSQGQEKEPSQELEATRKPPQHVLGFVRSTYLCCPEKAEAGMLITEQQCK